MKRVIKWIKYILFSIFGLIFLLIALFLIFKPFPYYEFSGIVGSQLQWYGYEELGNEMIEESIKNSENFSASDYHSVSVQNTKNGNYDEAIGYLEKASELNPKEVDSYYGWVLLYYYKDFEKALFHLNRFDDSTPDVVDYASDDNILYAKGLCYKEMGNYPKALELFSQAIQSELEMHDENWISQAMYFQKARTLHLLGEQEKAIEFYDKSIKVWDKSSESFYFKGLAQIELKDSIAGYQNLDSALSLIRKGYKTSDGYVELFDEVYQAEIEEAISKKQ